MKVFVYFNLHKHCWSVKALEGRMKGRVIAHESELVLTNATPKVSEAGRLRVLKEKRKYVMDGAEFKSASMVRFKDRKLVQIF